MQTLSGPREITILQIASVFRVPDGLATGRARRFDAVGGMQNYLFQVATRLDAAGLRQTIVTARRPGAPRWQRLGTRSEVWRVGLPIPWMRQLYQLPAARRASRIGLRADVVHAHLGEDIAVLPIAMRAAERRRLPLVVTIHSSARHTIQATDAKTAAVRALGGALEAALLPRADLIVTLSERTADVIRPHAMGEVEVLPPGADGAAFRRPMRDPHPDLPRPRIVFVGRLTRAKGVDLLIEAVSRLRSAVSLVVVGDGPERRRLEDMARALEVPVRFTGFLAPDLIPSTLCHSDVMAHPARYEELGMVLLDAMHAHLPIVATATGGIPSVVLDRVNGLLVPPDDAGALARALDEVLIDGSLRERLASGAAARSSLYNWDAVADRLARLYTDLVESKRGLVCEEEPASATVLPHPVLDPAFVPDTGGVA